MSKMIQINTINSNIRISSTRPQMKIRGQDATMNLRKTKAKFNIKTKSDTVEIHNYPADKQLYRKNPVDLQKDISNYSLQKGNQAISEYVQDGDRMMKIENNEKNAIANISLEKLYRNGKKEINVGYFPKEPIRIRVKKGYVNINYKPYKIDLNVKKNLNINSKKGTLNIGVDRYPKVEITTYDNKIDTKI
ncbi:hypothetical protein EV215_1794 [Hypnocyclicus thermotrophus]|uniref:Uncharacterized protein n=1 Tax=Hypnocyclicus thermotrophus TaxID=1627895 RepID=A0AA46I518_9FUSO|nr:DUF6470 family protein [Hypnocyclicus thermotrophus]TDT68073.1 hypothetical protein EV215_1794 [Hypnocyclicus thermotrophus]